MLVDGRLEKKLCDEVLLPIFTSLRSATIPGLVISTPSMESSLLIIFITADIFGRRLAVSCTQRRPSFNSRPPSSAGKSPSSNGSTSSVSRPALCSSHACNNARHRHYCHALVDWPS
nr:hypothetical protein CICLE_v10013160mg [Ipomoea trifida]